MKSQQIQHGINNIAQYIFTIKKQICLGITAISAFYLIFSLFELQIIIAFCVSVTALCGFLYFQWESLKKRGIINMFSPKTRKILLERSIMDIYRDLVYFPTITKIIGAFIRGAVTKPDPKQIHKEFNQLDPGFVKAINTKGILHLAPQKVQKLILENNQQCLDEIKLQNKSQNEDQAKIVKQSIRLKQYGKIIPKWDNQDKYEKSEIKVHEITIHDTALQNLSEKIKWRHLVILCGLVGYALMKTKGKKMGKIFLYNGSAIGIIVVSLLLAIKYSKKNNKRRQIKSIFEDIQLMSPKKL